MSEIGRLRTELRELLAEHERDGEYVLRNSEP
jgi:hypothetical protein